MLAMMESISGKRKEEIRVAIRIKRFSMRRDFNEMNESIAACWKDIVSRDDNRIII